MPQLLTAQEIAGQLQVHIETIYQWVSQKRIPYVKVGRATRFDQKDIDNWIEKRKIKARIGGVAI